VLKTTHASDRAVTVIGHVSQMEVANSFETSVTMYQITLQHIPEYSNLQTCFPYIYLSAGCLWYKWQSRYRIGAGSEAPLWTGLCVWDLVAFAM
jgi:hypothetical protein